MRERELAEFLMDHPNLIPFQQMLDIKLNSLTTPEERMKFLGGLIKENLINLNKELVSLSEKLECLNE